MRCLEILRLGVGGSYRFLLWSCHYFRSVCHFLRQIRQCPMRFGGKRHPVYGGSIVDSTLIHFDVSCIADITFKALRAFCSILVIGASAMIADSVICAGGLIKKVCCLGQN